jgi:hypothetical protein
MDKITKRRNEVLVKKLNRKASLLAQHVYLNQNNYQQDREGDRKTTKERNKTNKGGIRINIPFLHQT